MNKFVLSTLLLFIGFLAHSNEDPETDSLALTQDVSEEAMQIMWKNYIDSLDNVLIYDTGLVTLKDGIATIQVPDGFRFINGEQSEELIVNVWGNPPSDPGHESLGMLIPENVSPITDTSSYSINITYSNDGYIKDKDAKKLNYDDLLETMQEDTQAANENRIQQGYEPIELVGWASQPYYDFEAKKLHWAKELKFGDYPVNTLNYNIRILGRRGYLQLNAIGDVSVLDSVKNNIDPILANVNFSKGHQYSDFDPKLDQVAAYGIGGLIVGKALVKAGILAKLGLLLVKFWKVIAIGAVAFLGSIRKLFKKN